MAIIQKKNENIYQQKVTLNVYKGILEVKKLIDWLAFC